MTPDGDAGQNGTLRDAARVSGRRSGVTLMCFSRFAARVLQVGIFLCAAASCHADAVEEFEVSPTRIELSSRLDQVQLLVTEKTASGESRDVTRVVRFEIEGDRVVSIDRMGRVRAKSAGRTVVRVRHA